MISPWLVRPPLKKTRVVPIDDNPNTDTTRTWGAKSRQSPRHQNSVRRVLRIGQMAWEGRSAGEIADEIGVGVQYVYQLCSDYRIKLAKKTRSQFAFRVIIELRTLVRLEKIAAERKEGIEDLVTTILDALSREPVLLTNVLEDYEPPHKRKRRTRKKIADTVFEYDDREDDD